MSVTLGQLILQLQADTSAFGKGLQSAQKLAFDSSDAIVASLGKIGDKLTRLNFGDMEKSLKSLAMAGGVFAGAAAGIASAVVAVAESVAQQAHQMELLSQRYGVSIEDVSSLRVAAKLTGLDLESLTLGMGRMAKSAATVAEAIGGHAQTGAAFAFKALGLSADDLKRILGTGGGTMELLGKLADGFQKLGPGAASTALAMQVFGRAGAAMLPLLFQGSAGVKQLKDLSDELGLTWTQKDIQAATQFAERMEVLELKSTALKEQIGRGVLPAMESLAALFLRVDSTGNSLASTIGTSVGSAFAYLAKQLENAQYSAGMYLLQMQKVANIMAVSPMAYALNIGGARDTSSAQNAAVDLSMKQLTASHEKFQLVLAAGYNLPTKHGGKGLLDTVFGGEKGKTGASAIVEYSGAIKEAGKSTQQLLDEMEYWMVDVGRQPGFLEGAHRYFSPPGQMPQLGGLSGAPNYTGSILALNATNPQNIMSDALKKRLQDLNVFLDTGKTSADRYNDAIKALDETFGSDKGSPQYLKALQAIKGQLDTNSVALRNFGEEIGSAFMQGILHGQSMGQIFKALLIDVIKLIVQMTVLKNLQASAGSGGVGGFFSSIGLGLFGGMRAGGGPVYPGMAYIVNENTPNSEVFVPNVAGQIVNQSQIHSGTTIMVDARGADPNVEYLVQRGIQKALPGIVARSVAANTDFNRRR